jgi:hypothetical protein
MDRDDYWKKIGRTYRGKSGSKDRELVSITSIGEVTYRRVGEVALRGCWISTWLEWCKELLPEVSP